jgi:hypothetical protein
VAATAEESLDRAEQAVKLRAKAPPELADAVERGLLTLEAAAHIAQDFINIVQHMSLLPPIWPQPKSGEALAVTTENGWTLTLTPPADPANDSQPSEAAAQSDDDDDDDDLSKEDSG